MVFIGFHHVQLAMPPGGESEAGAFYGDVLGFEQMAKPVHLAVRGGCWFRSGRTELHLGVEDPFTPAHKAHPALLVKDLEQLRRRLLTAGVEPVLDTQLEGHERFYASDPSETAWSSSPLSQAAKPNPTGDAITAVGSGHVKPG